MAELRVHVLLNKGRVGIPLSKLSKIAEEFQRFLDMLERDVQIDTKAGWLGVDFTNSSLGFTAIRPEPVEERKAVEFRSAFRNIIKRRPDARIRRSTLRQYTRIAEPIDTDEVIGFTIPVSELSSLVPEEPVVHDLTKQEALLIAREVQGIVPSYGGFQGVIHSIFFGASPAHFQLRELSTGDLIKCVYSKKLYDDITTAVRKRNAVVHVYGLTKTDIVNRQIEELRVDRIEVAESLSNEDFEKFFGCAPAILGDHSLQEYINEVRGRAE